MAQFPGGVCHGCAQVRPHLHATDRRDHRAGDRTGVSPPEGGLYVRWVVEADLQVRLASAAKKSRPRQYNIAEAKARLPSLVRETLAGAEVIIAKDNKPLVKLVPVASGRRAPGTGKGQILYMSHDFDAPLEDFEDYM